MEEKNDAEEIYPLSLCESFPDAIVVLKKLCKSVEDEASQIALKVAIAALELQVPQKVLTLSGEDPEERWCPRCGACVGQTWNRHSWKPNCEECGQALDWDDEWEVFHEKMRDACKRW